jgi:hypothetical protein
MRVGVTEGGSIVVLNAASREGAWKEATAQPTGGSLGDGRGPSYLPQISG